jgi:hypothetical protein
MANANAFGATGQAKQRTASTTGTRETRDTRVSVPDESVVEYILAAVGAGDGLAEFPLHREDAVSVEELAEDTENETVTELLEALPEDVETLSFEDFFGLDLEEDGYEYVGTEPKLNESDNDEWSDLPEEEKEKYEDEDVYKYGDPENDLKAYMPEPDWVGIVRDNKIDGESIYEASTAINGMFYPEAYSHLNDDQREGMARIGVGVGKSYNNADEFEKRKHVSFTFQEGKSTQSRVLKAIRNMQPCGDYTNELVELYESGELDNDEFVQELTDNRVEVEQVEA